MTLVKRTSTVQCDRCPAQAEIEHDLECEADAGYAYNKAHEEAGWGQPFNHDRGIYEDLCPTCLAAAREAHLADKRRREARDQKLRRRG